MALFLANRGPEFASFQRVSLNATPEASGTWSGFDVAFCNGLAAAIFVVGDPDKVSFVEMNSTVHAFSMLAEGNVDVVAGARVTLQNSHREPSTGQGFAFSSPYYYDTIEHQGYGLMSNKEDAQWNDFIFWIVMGIIYAEEESITSATSVNMPVVELFGEDFKQMFRDCIYAVGSYAEIYNATLQGSIPRSGANMLYQDAPGPLHFPTPIE